MTSDENGCFVYITLPGQTKPVTAGRVVITQAGAGAVGQFVYGRSYRERNDAVEIDPIYLRPVGEGQFTHVQDSGLFPPLRDASPDWWGRMVIERVHGGQLDEIGYLLDSPDDRAGALGFGLGATPPAPKRDFNQTISLKALITVADAFVAGQKLEPDALVSQVERLHLVGTSMGGARPKAVVEDEEGLWLAKLPRKDDKYDLPRIEAAMLMLARECGIQTAQSKIVEVGGRSVLFVKRFDREKAPDGYLRHRMISGLTVLRASASATDRSRWSYPLLADEIRRVDRDQAKSRIELYRRMVFNALIANSDDHPRNHALIADQHGWRLSPAFDLTPIPTVAVDSRYLVMTVGEGGRIANRANLISQSERFGLKAEPAGELIDQMHGIVETLWYPVCRAGGVSEADCEAIRSAFAHDGFQPTSPEASATAGTSP